ncbi:hypothetical protein AMAG_06221 [Allomyces macrogynus ATCC 38327]|uniref:Protein-serine/threonine kinase n=1 Tax=Allomyces macrogynus (strain ATCC 38327) TaxID=578462 RepID=A0A0L0SFW5_ALLM3|nr:hypothetical protein AMAG_06221 [Allomyces macrogynus ATCC 38327]|eukprot:KNE61391.1 hypothetical protein AMAG_06221 [Allomyces macrogynus ATCC 38327]
MIGTVRPAVRDAARNLHASRPRPCALGILMHRTLTTTSATNPPSRFYGLSHEVPARARGHLRLTGPTCNGMQPSSLVAGPRAGSARVLYSTSAAASSTAGASGNAAAKRSQLHMLVQSLSARPITPVRIPDLLRIGQAATAAANGQPVHDDPFGQHPLVANAQFLQRELPVRLALRCKAFQSLPFIVGLNPHIHKVYTLYLDSLERLTSFRPVVNEDDEKEFTSMLTELVEAHVDVIQTISQGFLESRDYMPAQEIGQFLDKLIGARIGVRVLAEHHLALHSPQPDFIGIVDTKLSPVSVAQHVYDYVREVAQFHFGAAPALQIDGMVDTTLAYIPVHLDYILAELFKNSIRATVEHYEKTSGNGLGSLRLSAGLSDDDLPPIQLTVARGPDDVVMRIRDQGGGIPYEDLQRVFEYSYTSVQGKGYNRSATGVGASTADPQSAMSEMMMQSGIGGPIAGLGYGLGTARVYSRYFDGSLTMISLYGHGCDVFLRLKNIDMVSSDIKI